jgi:hypothetical protein
MKRTVSKDIVYENLKLNPCSGYLDMVRTTIMELMTEVFGMSITSLCFKTVTLAKYYVNTRIGSVCTVFNRVISPVLIEGIRNGENSKSSCSLCSVGYIILRVQM